MKPSWHIPILFLFLLVVHATASRGHERSRKSLSFRQPLPKGRFTIEPPVDAPCSACDSNVVAERFIEKNVLDAASGYYIRNDSYTDQRTGVSHVYARQVVNGIEIADADINLSIYGGRVLSHGSSVFMGKLPEGILNNVVWSQETYCDEIPPGTDPFVCDISLNRVRVAMRLGHDILSVNLHNPTAATYLFVVAANPWTSLQDIKIHDIIAVPQTCHNVISTSCWSVSPLPGVLSPIRAQLVYVQTHTPGRTSTQLNLAWRLEVEMEDNWYEAYVSAYEPSKIIAVGDWVKDGPAPREDGWFSSFQAKVFGQVVLGPEQQPMQTDLFEVPGPSVAPSFSIGSYRVWKWGVNDPASGGRTLERSSYNSRTSPLGWHFLLAANDPIAEHPDLKSDDILNYTTTVGNNAIAQSNWAGGPNWKNNSRPDGGSGLVFDFSYDKAQNPKQNVNTSVTQLFYLANMYHDLLYLYGFDELSGNFQQYNFGKGGVEGDGVIMNAQDGSGYNNANFLTARKPPDGQNGKCRMYIWNTVSPPRDGGLDAGIVIHELSHGLSTRLTGGPSNSQCLDYTALEASGMGEGWSDFIATLVRSTSTYSDYPIGAWVANKAAGIRYHPYAINVTVNPFMYDYLQQPLYLEVHAIGEIWAEILWVTTQILIHKHGFAESLFPSSSTEFYRTITHDNGQALRVPTRGNTLMLQLVVTGMKIQPCRPTFIQARDAIIAADRVHTGGENECLLWSGFASRGLGTDATPFNGTAPPSINGFMVPDHCK